MKKILCLIIAFVLTLCLAGCVVIDTPSDNDPIKETSSASTPTPTTEAPAKTTFGLNETATFKNLKFTASELLESEGENFFTPASGKIFVGVKFTIENISSETQNVSSLLLFEAYCDDIKLEYSFNATCAFDGTLDGEVAPGKKLVGYYAVEVPENWGTVELVVRQDWLSNKSATFAFNNN